MHRTQKVPHQHHQNPPLFLPLRLPPQRQHATHHPTSRTNPQDDHPMAHAVARYTSRLLRKPFHLSPRRRRSAVRLLAHLLQVGTCTKRDEWICQRALVLCKETVTRLAAQGVSLNA